MFGNKLNLFIPPLILFLIFGFLYLHNLSPSVYGGDVGDFVTSASVAGVAHAPGYPIFIFLGFLLIHLLPFFTPAFAMGLLSAFAGIGGIIVCYFLVKILTKSSWSAALTAVTLGVSYLYWFYTEIAEVFALHSFLVLLLLYLSLKFGQTRKKKWLYWFALILGVASVTHQTIVFFVPSYLLLLLPNIEKGKNKSKKTRRSSSSKMFSSFRISPVLLWKKIITFRKIRVHITKELPKTFLITIGLFIMPWFSYVYVFIASSHHPVINWDNVHDLHSFLQLVLRRDYGTFTAGLFQQPIFAQRIVIIKTYLFTILTQLTIPVIVVSVLGLISLWFYSRRYTIAFLLAFLIGGPIFIWYAGFPLTGNFLFGVYERFFTMSTLPIMLFFGYGVFSIATYFARFFQRPVYFIVFHLLFFLIPFQLLFYNFPKTNLSNVWIGDTLSMDFLMPLPHGSVLLIGDDTPLFNTWYVHYARHIRPDIKLVDLFTASSDPSIQREEENVKKTNPNTKGNELIAKTLNEIATRIPVYSLDPVQSPGRTTLTWIPTGLLYKLSLQKKPEDEAIYLQEVERTLRQIHTPNAIAKNYRNLTIADIPQAYAKALWAVGNYLQINYKDVDRALVYYKKAIGINPSYANAYTTTGLIYLTQKPNCLRAEENFQQAIAEEPYTELPYFLLYTTYGECLHDKNKANRVVVDFKKKFKEDFFRELTLTLKSLK